MVFGIVLNRNGWRIDYLGMSTPVEELAPGIIVGHGGISSELGETAR